MGFSIPTNVSLQTVDFVAPGMVQVIEPMLQTSNTKIAGVIAWPNLDADGTDLTGLKKGYACTLMESEPGVSPVEGLSGPQVLAIPGVVVQPFDLTPTDAGQTKGVEFPVLAIGPNQWFSFFCED